MDDIQDKFTDNFVCLKCHARHAQAREIVLTKSKLLDLIPSKDNRYVEVTCMLCGFTEFYNRAIYIKSHQTETNNVNMTDGAEEG